MALHAVPPKILGFISEDASAWLVALLTFAAGGLLTAVLAVATGELYERQLRQRFELLASERSSRMEERLADQAQRLDNLRRFMMYSDTVTRSEFNGFTRPLLARTQGYSWAPRVTDDGREAFETAVRAQGPGDFTIRQPSTGQGLQPATRRAEYYPILFGQAQSNVTVPLGLDLAYETLRKATLQRARKLARMTVSSPVALFGTDARFDRGVLLVTPVTDVASGDLLGFVTAIISMQQLMAEGMPSANEDNLQVEMLDLSNDMEHESLFRSGSSAAGSPLHAMRMLHLADRTYQMNIRPSQVFVEANQSNAVAIMGVSGALLSLLLSALLSMLVSQRQRAQRRVEQRTGQLRASERELRATHNELRNILDAATQVAIIATDLRGIITTFNAGAEIMLGYSSDQAVGRLALIDLHLPEELMARAAVLSQQAGRDVPMAQAMLVDTAAQGAGQAREWTLVRRNGSHLTVNMLATALVDEAQQWVGHLAICIDITESRRVLEALAARDRLLHKLSAEVPGAIFQFSRDEFGHSRFPYASQGMLDIYEVDPSRLYEHAGEVAERIHPSDLERVSQSVTESAEQLTPWRVEYRVQLPRRGVRWIRGEATPEPWGQAGTLWHGYLSDITDLKQIEEELRALSVTDVLTGIYNRRYFQQRLQEEMGRSRRDHLQLSLIMLDIDHFKKINDQFGHAMGDWALQALCERISQRVRRSDVFCRLGGEEFMVLCPSTSSEQAYTLAIELWQALRSSPIDGVGTVTASFGVANWRPGEGADALLQRADSGVYAAKQAGRDRVEPEFIQRDAL
jgi:diguanylate cyclase (GGDEF)-like protein/PAS domain S-box-containing protein